MKYKYHILLIALLALTVACEPKPEPQPEPKGPALRDGDIIFQTSKSAQSEAIRLAIGSQWTHMGVIHFIPGGVHVYEAYDQVRDTPLQEWIDRGEGGHYIVKRLKEHPAAGDREGIHKIVKVARSFGGKPYDSAFEWSDERIYCSELVWKIYDRGFGIQIGKLQQLKDFDLTHPAVRAKLEERYGKTIPLEETVISPAAMFDSPLLVEVWRE